MAEVPPGPRSVRIRQIALCTDDVWPAEQRLVAELGVAGVQRDPANVFEMRNVVFAVGDTFLEVLQPTAPSAPSARFLERHGGPGGYMLILQVDDLSRARSRVDALDVRVVFDSPPAEVHGVRASSIHLHPSDHRRDPDLLRRDGPVGRVGVGRAGVGRPRPHRGGGADRRRRAGLGGTRCAGRALRHPRRPTRSGPDRTVELDDSRVRVVPAAPGRRDQLQAVELVASDRSRAGEELHVAGTALRLV